jgi:hypothetical protein
MGNSIFNNQDPKQIEGLQIFLDFKKKEHDKIYSILREELFKHDTSISEDDITNIYLTHSKRINDIAFERELKAKHLKKTYTYHSSSPYEDEANAIQSKYYFTLSGIILSYYCKYLLNMNKFLIKRNTLKYKTFVAFSDDKFQIEKLPHFELGYSYSKDYTLDKFIKLIEDSVIIVK